MTVADVISIVLVVLLLTIGYEAYLTLMAYRGALARVGAGGDEQCANCGKPVETYNERPNDTVHCVWCDKFDVGWAAAFRSLKEWIEENQKRWISQPHLKPLTTKVGLIIGHIDEELARRDSNV